MICRSLNEECQTYVDGNEKPDPNFAMFAVTAVSVGERGRPVNMHFPSCAALCAAIDCRLRSQSLSVDAVMLRIIGMRSAVAAAGLDARREYACGSTLDARARALFCGRVAA